LDEISALEVVLSGFFGTVGLYEPVGEEKIAEAKEALKICGLSAYESRLFKDLPWGVQRLVLAARAFVRRPPLMILDEPCTGLDDEHRGILLEALNRIAEEAKATGRPTILLVSHDPAERLSFLGVHLLFYPDGYTKNGQPRYRWKVTRTPVQEVCSAYINQSAIKRS
jgi:molybdate transport system ATP-binding protein